MPHPKSNGRPPVPAHECSWFPISWYEDGEPALYACGRIARCIKTMTAKEFNGKRDRPPTMPSPYPVPWDASDPDMGPAEADAERRFASQKINPDPVSTLTLFQKGKT